MISSCVKEQGVEDGGAEFSVPPAIASDESVSIVRRGKRQKQVLRPIFTIKNGLGVTQHEFNALVTITYNGPYTYGSSFMDEMVSGQLEEESIKNIFYNYIDKNADDDFKPGLKNRADAEFSVFFHGTYIDIDKNPIEFDIIKNYEK